MEVEKQSIDAGDLKCDFLASRAGNVKKMQKRSYTNTVRDRMVAERGETVTSERRERRQKRRTCRAPSAPTRRTLGSDWRGLSFACQLLVWQAAVPRP